MTRKDKIQEIMTLLDIAVAEAEDGQPTFGYRCQIESKLRELVREPLNVQYPDDMNRVNAQLVFSAGWKAAERAHNITNTSGVE